MFSCRLAVVITVDCQAGYVPPGPRYDCPSLHHHQTLLSPCNCTPGSDIGLYITCDQTSLASLSVGLANIGALHFPIEELTVSSGNFAHLYGELLYTLKIRVLCIKDTPIKTINYLTLMEVNRTLQEVHIVNSKLQEFPKEAFRNLGNLTVLNIDGHEIKILKGDMFSMSAAPYQLKKLSVVNGALSHVAVEALISCNRLRFLDLHNNSLLFLNKGQFKGQRDLQFLDLSYNNLARVDATQMADLNNLIFVNISHNALPELTRGTFVRNNRLLSLDISHNKLRMLDTNTFRGMRLLRRLYMSDNNISKIEEGTFQSLSFIRTIDIARNLLRKIGFQMFSSMSYIKVIDVSQNILNQISRHSFMDMSMVHINLSHNVITNVERGAFVNCPNISVLDLSHNNLSMADLLYGFDEDTYTTELQLSYNFFTDLSQVPLVNMTGLKMLNVSHNKLTMIPRNSLPKLYYLHTVDLSYNQISSIHTAVFQPVFGLHTIYLQHNELQELQVGTFGSLPVLHLDLSYNQLSCVHKEAMIRLLSLRTMLVHHNNISEMFDIPWSLSHVDLSYNSLTFKTPPKWPSVNSLITLNLSHNFLRNNLGLQSFTNLLTLHSLDISFNGITAPPKEALEALPSLQQLNLESNEISELERQSFGLLPDIAELNLANNRIESLIDHTFLELKGLTALNLSFNNIATVSTSAFKGLIAVRTLDLSSNKINVLDNKTNSIFEDLLHLEMLNLSWNKISCVTQKSFPSSQWVPYQLKHLDLSHNKMSVLSYEMTFGTKTLLSLNLSNNNINKICKSVIGNLTSLEVLDLSDNMINDLTAKDVFQLPENLKSLNLASNILLTFSVEPILKARNLRHLDLRENQLEQFDNQLMPAIVKGTIIDYNDNALSCDCHLRPVRRWALSLNYPEPVWSQFICQYPEETENIPLLELPEELMFCNTTETVDFVDKEEYQLTPDVKFRTINKLNEGSIQATWYVVTKNDVAGFKLIVRNISDSNAGAYKSTKLVWEKLEPYNIRNDTISTIPKDKRLRFQVGAYGERFTTKGFTKSMYLEKLESLELCVVAVTSEGETQLPKPSQCHKLATNNSATDCNCYSQFLFVIAASVLVFSQF